MNIDFSAPYLDLLANNIELPTLLLADQIHPFLRYLMVAVIFNSCNGLFISIVLFFRWSYFKFFVKPKN